MSGRIINRGSEHSPPYGAHAIFYDIDGNVLQQEFDPKLKGLDPGEEESISYLAIHPGNGHTIVDHEIKIDVRE